MVAYPSWLVDDEMLLQFASSCRECFSSDDMTISLVLDARHVPRIELEYERGLFPFLSYGLNGDALH